MSSFTNSESSARRARMSWPSRCHTCRVILTGCEKSRRSLPSKFQDYLTGMILVRIIFRTLSHTLPAKSHEPEDSSYGGQSPDGLNATCSSPNEAHTYSMAVSMTYHDISVLMFGGERAVDRGGITRRMRLEISGSTLCPDILLGPRDGNIYCSREL